MPTLSSPSAVSFRPLLVDAVADFLRSEGWPASQLAEAVGETVTSLAKYREEGIRLFPVVFLTRDLNLLFSQVGGRDPLPIGHGEISPATVRRALKHCAPLGEGRSWVVYFLIEENRLHYGVFRTTGSPVEPTALERLRRKTTNNEPILGIVQIAENVIEVRASAERYRYIHLSGLSSEQAPTTRTARDFIGAVTHDIDPELKPCVMNFYYRVVLDVMQVWHGALAAVLPKGAPIPAFLSDGVILESPLDIQSRVRSYLRGDPVCTAGDLLAEANLIRGMMSADGITLLGSDGRVLGYNIFMGHPTDKEYPETTTSEGGARYRTYRRLCQHVGQELVAAFYRSQDGNASSIWQFA